jgi:hypothetical protein
MTACTATAVATLLSRMVITWITCITATVTPLTETTTTGADANDPDTG